MAKKHAKQAYLLIPQNGQPLTAFIGLKDESGVFLLVDGKYTKHYEFADGQEMINALGADIIELHETIKAQKAEIERVTKNWHQARNVCRRVQAQLKKCGIETEYAEDEQE